MHFAREWVKFASRRRCADGAQKQILFLGSFLVNFVGGIIGTGLRPWGRHRCYFLRARSQYSRALFSRKAAFQHDCVRIRSLVPRSLVADLRRSGDGFGLECC